MPQLCPLPGILTNKKSSVPSCWLFYGFSLGPFIWCLSTWQCACFLFWGHDIQGSGDNVLFSQIFITKKIGIQNLKARAHVWCSGYNSFQLQVLASIPNFIFMLIHTLGGWWINYLGLCHLCVQLKLNSWSWLQPGSDPSGWGIWKWASSLECSPSLPLSHPLYLSNNTTTSTKQAKSLEKWDNHMLDTGSMVISKIYFVSLVERLCGGERVTQLRSYILITLLLNTSSCIC